MNPPFRKRIGRQCLLQPLVLRNAGCWDEALTYQSNQRIAAAIVQAISGLRINSSSSLPGFLPEPFRFKSPDLFYLDDGLRLEQAMCLSEYYSRTHWLHFVDIPFFVKTEFVDTELPQQIRLKWIRNTMIDDIVFAFVF